MRYLMALSAVFVLSLAANAQKITVLDVSAYGADAALAVQQDGGGQQGGGDGYPLFVCTNGCQINQACQLQNRQLYTHTKVSLNLAFGVQLRQAASDYAIALAVCGSDRDCQLLAEAAYAAEIVLLNEAYDQANADLDAWYLDAMKECCTVDCPENQAPGWGVTH